MKPDSEKYRALLNALPKKLALDKIRAHWTKYAFHFTDIRNAANILKSGRINCRANLPQNGFVDTASPRVIAQTDIAVKSNVRFYFRPRTPTQYQSEGFRPRDRYWEGSHCPAPVFFLFDLFQLLVRDDCCFSDRNLAGRLGFDGLCSTADQLEGFDFSKIYHDNWVSKESVRDVVSHKNAEIVIPQEVDLEALKLIYCRSAAEKETLLHLLSDATRSTWSRKIAVASTTTLFYRKWAFVERASLLTDRATIYFSPDPEVPGPFEMRLVRKTGSPSQRLVSNFSANGPFTISFPSEIPRYELELYLDENLAFAGSFNETMDEIPF